MPKISILMPCLNSAEYLSEAVDSVLAQTCTDFELIAVDSGSTDGTRNILEEYVKKDKRVRLLDCDRKSMGAQYNKGLLSAQGEYIGFVESDDYIDPMMYETLLRGFEGNTADYVKADFDLFVDLPDKRLFYTHGPIAGNRHDYYNRVIGPEELSQVVRRDIYIWNGLYKREFIERHNIRFNETPGAAFQDAGFVSQVLFHGEQAVYRDVSLYRYRKGNTAASSSGIRTHEFVMDEFEYVIHKLKSHPEKEYLFLPAFLRRYFGAFHNCLHQYLYHNGYTEELRKRVKPFRELFQACSNALTFPQLTRSDLWPPQDLVLFFEDFKGYCNASLERYKSDIDANIQAAQYLKKQEALVICGQGENGASVYCYLKRQGLQNVAAFCRDGESDYYYGKEVLGMQEAVRCYPNGVFLITRDMGNEKTVMKGLRELGVDPERILYYGAGLFHHNWHELPIESKHTALSRKKEGGKEEDHV